MQKNLNEKELNYKSKTNNKPNQKKWYSYIDIHDAFDIEANGVLKAIIFAAFAVLAFAVILQEKEVFDVLANNAINSAETVKTLFKGIWPPLWLSWIEVSVLLLARA